MMVVVLWWVHFKVSVHGMMLVGCVWICMDGGGGWCMGRGGGNGMLVMLVDEANKWAAWQQTVLLCR
ncbi:hypothetical protein [Enterobacter roggenkampii]